MHNMGFLWNHYVYSPMYARPPPVWSTCLYPLCVSFLLWYPHSLLIPYLGEHSHFWLKYTEHTSPILDLTSYNPLSLHRMCAAYARENLRDIPSKMMIDNVMYRSLCSCEPSLPEEETLCRPYKVRICYIACIMICMRAHVTRKLCRAFTVLVVAYFLVHYLLLQTS
jgi:hypothetical protein